MSTLAAILASPEWEEMRSSWRQQTCTEFAALNARILDAAPNTLAREVVFIPAHDLTGLSGTFGYTLVSAVARSLTEGLRSATSPLDEPSLARCRTHLSLLLALLTANIDGDGGSDGAAALADLARHAG